MEFDIKPLQQEKEKLDAEIKARQLSGGEIEGRTKMLHRQAVEAFEESDARIARRITELRAEIETLQNPTPAGDPILALDADSLARAANLKAFLADDLALPPHELKRKIDAVVQSGDTAAMAVYHRLLGDGVTHKTLRGTLSRALNPAAKDADAKIESLRAEWSDLARKRGEGEKRLNAFVGKNGITLAI